MSPINYHINVSLFIITTKTKNNNSKLTYTNYNYINSLSADFKGTNIIVTITNLYWYFLIKLVQIIHTC